MTETIFFTLIASQLTAAAMLPALLWQKWWMDALAVGRPGEVARQSATKPASQPAEQAAVPAPRPTARRGKRRASERRQKNRVPAGRAPKRARAARGARG